jgi:hypothetical protein
MIGRKRTLTVAVVAGVLVAVGAVSPAGAAGVGTGQTLGAGDSRCSDRISTDGEVRVVGQLTYGTGEWTVRRAAAAGAPETVVLRAAAGSLNGRIIRIDRTLPPTGAGSGLYRFCLTVDRVVKGPFFSWANYDLTISSAGAATVTDLGPETAALSQYAIACGDLTVVPGHTVRLVGSASHPVRWMVIVMDESPVFEGDRYPLLLDSTSVDRTLTLDPEILAVTACANQLVNPTRATVSWELSA